MRKLIILAFFLFAVNIVFAAEVGLEEARSFAKGWRGKNVSAARTHKTAAGENRFHVVSFEGGGWAAVGADDEEAPVIAFSDNGEDLVEDEKNPVWFLVRRDAERRAKGREFSHKEHKGHRGKHKGWEYKRKVEGRGKKIEGGGGDVREVREVGSVKTTTLKTSINDSGLEDIRVAPMIESAWNQQSGIYNYYTPNGYPCGCVATMMAQMMRYFEWPKTSVDQETYPCYIGTTIPQSITTSMITMKTMMGGVYDWSKMDLRPNASTPEANRQEIGKLCYDCGVSVSMMWASGGSGAYALNVREALTKVFGYSDAHCVAYDYPTKEQPVPFHPYDFEELKTIVISNCEAGLPVGYGISGSSGGHAVVIDGYGYSGESFFIHINPGWGSAANAWYSPPDLTMRTDYQTFYFSSSDELIYNVFTEGSGALVTGKVTDEEGEPIEHAEVGGYVEYKEEVQLSPMITKTVTKTQLINTVLTDSSGKYHLKIPIMGRECKLYATARYRRTFMDKRESDPFTSQTMLGGSTKMYAFWGYYSTNGYSLGNAYDFDFTLEYHRETPKVLFK